MIRSRTVPDAAPERLPGLAADSPWAFRARGVGLVAVVLVGLIGFPLTGIWSMATIAI
jgi:hypothetical protein